MLIAYRLREALTTLIQVCEGNPGALSTISSDIERAKAVLAEVPDQIND